MSGDAPWYKDAIFYELRVRSFYDGNGDGVGDFAGLVEKLDYLQDLGVDTLWLLPFYPSPLKDDGYDISDYTDVHPECGTLQDFKLFVREAHRRNLRVVTELVLNHVSDQHAWFQRARRDRAGKWRDYFVWSDTPERYKDARIIFKDFETSNWAWDPVAGAYFWHRFYSNQPDLNYDHPAVRKAVMEVLDFWLDLGVDGLRLDAVPYLYEREGTNCENLPETHAFLKALRRHVDQKFRHRMLLAEANQWPEDAVAYFGEGDECHMAFHFPIMPRLFMALHMEDAYPVIDILQQTPAIPEAAQWALFLRNHDELTLEMVTDEERDYMYRVYAHDPQARINLGIRRRLAPLLGNHRRRIELMNALLFSLPGSPVLYYGDEIGMGDNIYLGDRNGVRTPMQWSADRNAGFSRANPQRLILPVVLDPEYHYEAVNVEAQQANPHSLLWWMKRLIALRRRFKAFGRGSLEFVPSRNPKVLTFLRRYGPEEILVVANLSRFAQYVELDLSRFRGKVALELFGGTEFPPIGELPYLLTLGPHHFYWFALVPQRREEVAAAPAGLPHLEVSGAWTRVFADEGADALAAAFPRFLETKRWFGGKARRIKETAIAGHVAVPAGPETVELVLVRVEYTEGDPDIYVVPVGFATGERAAELERQAPQRLCARLTVRGPADAQTGLLYDAAADPEFGRALLDGIVRRRRFGGAGGGVRAGRTRALAALLDGVPGPLEARLGTAEQSHTSLLFGDRLILKLLRRTGPGENPDLELGRFLTERAKFPHAPPLAGFLEYRRDAQAPMTLAVLHGFVPNEGDAWRFTLDEVERYFERAAIRQRESGAPSPAPLDPVVLIGETPPDTVTATVGGYLETARLLGQRTAELHLALASATDDPAFAPERFSTLYQRALYQSMRNLAGRVFRQLRDRHRTLPKPAAEEAEAVLAAEARVLHALRGILDRKVSVVRIRVHGDYHLGQVLYTGKDFVIIDFEGEPARPLSERRIKRSALRDVAGMLRSLHYAAYTVLATRVGAEHGPALEPWARLWHAWVSSNFLRAYLRTAGEAPFVPRTHEELAALLHAYLLDKAVYEVGYELNHRPEWTWIPLRGIRQLLEIAPRS
ncbi:MAG TPA: maltose alpha-D-glucosyltransferase [Gemmatimonadales bacterium]|nr:maltose alpha-D-glucosyltransferase [Gemmatimonadales bacterium]